MQLKNSNVHNLTLSHMFSKQGSEVLSSFKNEPIFAIVSMSSYNTATLTHIHS